MLAVEITALGPTKRDNKHAEVEPNVLKICLYTDKNRSATLHTNVPNKCRSIVYVR